MSALRKSSVWGYLLKYGVPLVITIGLCYLLLTGVDFDRMVQTIRTDCNFQWIALALSISVVSHIIRAMRWQIQLNALGVHPPLWNTILSIFGTYAVNLVFPRLGEFWRTGYIAQRQNAPFTTVFGSMVADRVVDMLLLLLIVLATFLLAGHQIASYLSQNTASYDRWMALASTPLLWLPALTVIIVAAGVMWHYRHSRAVTALARACRGLWQGFTVVATMPRRGLWMVLTLATWGCYFIQLYLTFFAFPLTAEVVTTYGFEAVMVCFVFSSLSMVVPSNGGIGPWQWAIIFGLSLYPVAGLDKEYATTFANLVMGTQTLLVIVLGIITFICVGIDKRRRPLQPSTSD